MKNICSMLRPAGMGRAALVPSVSSPTLGPLVPPGSLPPSRLSRKPTLFKFRETERSYGTTGNDQIGDYQFLNTYAAAEGLNYQGIVGIVPQRLYNPDFGWETNRKLEAALEAGMFKDRLFAAVAWYRNLSSSQLVGIPLSEVTGFNCAPVQS